MLQELKSIRQHPNEPLRRWFCDDFFDLIVWLDKSQAVQGFQLCYDIQGLERAFDWREGDALSHHKVDGGEGSALQPKASPVLVQDGKFDKERIAEAFAKASANIDPLISEMVLKKIRTY